ncbi:hypothetical protein ACP70R_024754 [Stipagrostis hirtigluma subsp. patula]
MAAVSSPPPGRGSRSPFDGGKLIAMSKEAEAQQERSQWQHRHRSASIGVHGVRAMASFNAPVTFLGALSKARWCRRWRIRRVDRRLWRGLRSDVAETESTSVAVVSCGGVEGDHAGRKMRANRTGGEDNSIDLVITGKCS